ncbi:uracil-DNA glycosylase [Legionella oakridgensis]|uniref:Aracil DNA glycosylase n=2 Tax=Legionella oakridgensis TaxID=29423 RepID=W0BF13_9GAMM|nr:uracil-DNA glycosylase [Legionella oakridgensis]AHE67246.1 aracil DNA glycosylase [Legionella oakridgensis ATCC 33761 = DSM 21215]ETO93206.1 uracil-DNA glycosylase [Legionella oakridgensis RV-2-2007]KTD37959.1 uracil DNA glycosylase [Legionella oakridgensis]STY20320.1 uracil-DNA glycosylase [Legionella longbeachae]
MRNIIEQAHEQWRPILHEALDQVADDYLQQLDTSQDWLPGKKNLFAAFSMPLTATQYILLGESPYPRAQSANGYAFWDNSVGSLWSSNGLSKEVNRATSLRNWIKMLLYARGDLKKEDFSQQAIAKLDKTHYIKTAKELFNAFMDKGFLLLNASLVYSEGKVNYHARHWRPFVHCLFRKLAELKPSVQLILLGHVAKQIPEANLFPSLVAEHPYNISFITNPQVVAFFKPMDLLRYHE